MAVEWMLGAFGGAKALGLPDAAVGLLDKALKACAGAEALTKITVPIGLKILFYELPTS